MRVVLMYSTPSTIFLFLGMYFFCFRLILRGRLAINAMTVAVLPSPISSARMPPCAVKEMSGSSIFALLLSLMHAQLIVSQKEVFSSFGFGMVEIDNGMDGATWVMVENVNF